MSADNRRVKVSSSRIIDYRSLNEQQVEDITLDFFYKPHTLTLLSGLLLALLYTACTRDNSDETLNVYHGVLTIRLVRQIKGSVSSSNKPRNHNNSWNISVGSWFFHFHYYYFQMDHSRDLIQRFGE